MAAPPDRAKAQEVKQIKHWKELPKEPKPPTRKAENAVGTIGRPIKLRANYYEVEVKDWKKKLVHYDVVIELAGKKELDFVISKRRKLEIFEKFKETNKVFFKQYQLAYDGMKSAVSIGEIPQLMNGAHYSVNVNSESGKSSQFRVTLKIVNKASLFQLNEYLKASLGSEREFPATVFQLIEIMFRHTPSTQYLPIGQNSFFSKELDDPFGKSEAIAGDMVAQRGFFASLRPAAWKDGSLLLNVDVSHAVFYKEQSVLHFMKENGIFGYGGPENKILPHNKRIALKKKLIRLKVKTTHSQFPRTYKVIDIMDKGASTLQFEVKEGTMKTVKEYFKDTYPRAHLKYDKLNVIRAAPDTRTVYLPIEHCHIAKGQKVHRQNLGSKETASFMAFTAKPPHERLRNINEIVRNPDITENQFMKDLGFSFLDKPIELTGRVLPAPEVQMNSNRSITPFNGKWDIRDSKFFKSMSIACWAVLNYADTVTKQEIQTFVDDVIKTGRFRGMNISQPAEIVSIVDHYQKNPDRDLPAIKERHPPLQLLMVILATKKADSPYAAVKTTGDRVLNIPTQCFLARNVKKIQSATVGNLLFKMNAKMGGINNILGERQLFVCDRPVMIMGADVNHPPASDKSGTPSIAAVVGSLDRHAFKYSVEVRPQESRREMIEKMQEMTISLLKSFFGQTGRKPERLIMFRDGVSESQFLEVLSFELRAIRKACTTLQKDGNYQPAITFIVVQKRHHTRFFPVNERDGVGKNKNVPPGTIVDTAVTHPSEIDFYLCSHEGIQGTSKPTHYRVLWDDSDFTIDQLQTLSYEMCHLYARCARSVSIPTPAYYAHWAAYRGKIHLHEVCCWDTKEEDKLSHDELLSAVRMDMNMANEVNKRMYFL